jgi:type I restriction enzyme S subunit
MDHIDDFLFDGLHLLVGEDGSVETTDGKPFLQLVDGKFWVNNHAHVLKGLTDSDTKFLYYALSTVAIRPFMSGSVQAKLSQGNLNKIPIPYPPAKDTRRAIVHILGTLDDKIALNRRMNKTLEAMARAFFKSWFVDFDPVRAKAEGRDPGLPKHLADLFPDSFEDSALGGIPKGWEPATLADLASLNPEAWSKETRPLVIDYIDLSNTKWGRIEAVTPYSQDDAPSRAQRVLRQRDTIVGTVRPGNGSYAFISDDGLTGSTGFAVLRPQKNYYAELVYLAATAAENIESLAHLADGAAYPAVRPDVVAATQIVKARPAICEYFSRITSPMIAKLAASDRESRTLVLLRDALLPKLISGELPIEDAERFIGSDD